MDKRLDHLDGLRGIAAVIVVIFHFMSATLPWLVPDQQHNAYWLAYTPLAVLWNGTFAVSIFFVLSGLVVTNATLRKSDPLFVDATIRYVRLAVPAGISTLLGWALLSAYPTAASELFAHTSSRWLQWTYQGEIPSVGSAAFNGFIGVFISGGSFYNNVLWTMKPELLGSLVCFTICTLNKSNLRIIASIAASLIFVIYGKHEYVCFCLGILLREALVSHQFSLDFSVPALILGLTLGSQSGDAAEVLKLTWLPQFLKPEMKGSLIYPIAATFVVYGCNKSEIMISLLSQRTAKFLGRISFPLYLIHVPFIYTIFAYHFTRISSLSAVLFLLLFSAFFLIISAYVMERWIEKPFLRALGSFRKIMQSGHSSALNRLRQLLTCVNRADR